MFFCKIQKRFNADHSATCDDCRHELMTAQLLSHRAMVIDGQATESMPKDFMYRLATRLRAEPEQIVSSWEAAIVSLRGWAVTCAAATLLLVAVAATVAITRTQLEDGIFSSNANEAVSHESIWSGE